MQVDIIIYLSSYATQSASSVSALYQDKIIIIIDVKHKGTMKLALEYVRKCGWHVVLVIPPEH
jgi:hypothetical protein